MATVTIATCSFSSISVMIDVAGRENCGHECTCWTPLPTTGACLAPQGPPIPVSMHCLRPWTIAGSSRITRAGTRYLLPRFTGIGRPMVVFQEFFGT
jgi:hypothetical protein